MEPITSDKDVQHQHKLLEEIRTSPYFKHFEPRSYDTYFDRYQFPIAFLEDIGIEKICELVEHGWSLMKVAKALDLSIRVVRRWIANNPVYQREFDMAERWSADQYMDKAEDVLLEAPLLSEALNKAGKLSAHYELRAKYLNKEKYGTTNVKIDATLNQGVSYVFNITPQKPKQIIEGDYKELEHTPPPSASHLIDVIESLKNA